MSSELAPVTFKQVSREPRVLALLDGANEVMKAMGYTEHGRRHAGLTARRTAAILQAVGVEPREVELGQIAAYCHDVGNVVNRYQHAQIGASLMFPILDSMGMPPTEIAPILGAIGNHEESIGSVVSRISAAVVLADKSDVHDSRVQNPDQHTFDIHDRVNFATKSSVISIEDATRVLALVIEIDTSFASVMEYFEIFLSRMVMCRSAADFLGYRFSLQVNGTLVEPVLNVTEN